MFNISDGVVAPDAAAPLTPVQRRVLRDLLHTSWRDHVEHLTDLSVKFHTYSPGDVSRRDIDARLAELRRALVDIEAALHRLNSGSYGRCDGCERRIPFELLEVRPHSRWCHRCQPLTPAADGALL